MQKLRMSSLQFGVELLFASGGMELLACFGEVQGYHLNLMSLNLGLTGPTSGNFQVAINVSFR